MFCPSCGHEDRTESKFCKRCGTNLRMVTLALTGQPLEDHDDAFVRKLATQQEMMSHREMQKKRQGMITGGIISSFAGLGIMIFLSVIEGPKPGMVGMVPFMVGVGLILSALLLYRPKRYSQHLAETPPPLDPSIGAQTVPPSFSHPESVTAETTRRLEEIKPPRA